MNLWPHQQFALQAIQQNVLAGNKNICVAAPTGAGKTVIMTELIKSEPNCCLYTHRKSLLSQTAGVLDKLNLSFGFRASGHELATLRETQLCMIQSEYRATRDGRRLIHPAKNVLVDEAHANSGPTCMELYGQHEEQSAVRIGFTATPTGIGHAYETLIQAGTNSELRKCGAHVPAVHYSPDEPDTKLIGKVKIDGGECAIGKRNRERYCHRVFGSVVENYKRLNPDRRPAILFAPGVAESKWFCDQLNKQGISAAHIDGEHSILDGEQFETDIEIREEIRRRLESGELHVVTNRFVLREGVDWPFLYHCIFATMFGGITSYLQAGGRVVRNHPSIEEVIIQDHGGNSLRHGSLNEDREWDLSLSDNQIYQIRRENIRDRKEPEPIVCPKCASMRLHGRQCHKCGYQHTPDGRRPVLQSDGTLKLQKVGEFLPRRYMPDSEKIRMTWESRVKAVRRSKKESVMTMTFAQLHANIARENNWKFAPKTLPMMPTNNRDWYRPIRDVPTERLRHESLVH